MLPSSKLGKSEWRHDGVTYLITPPETAGDVLRADLWICSHIEESGSSRHIAMLAEWCSWYVDASADDVDELGLHAMVDLKRAIIAAASMPDRVLDSVYNFYRVLYSGGCECLKCADASRFDKLDETSRDRVERSCRFSGVRSTDIAIADMAHMSESADPLAMPWWLYQLHARRQAGINRGTAEKREREEDGRKAQEMLKEKGLWHGSKQTSVPIKSRSGAVASSRTSRKSEHP